MTTKSKIQYRVTGYCYEFTPGKLNSFNRHEYTDRYGHDVELYADDDNDAARIIAAVNDGTQLIGYKAHEHCGHYNTVYVHGTYAQALKHASGNGFSIGFKCGSCGDRDTLEGRVYDEEDLRSFVADGSRNTIYDLSTGLTIDKSNIGTL